MGVYWAPMKAERNLNNSVIKKGKAEFFHIAGLDGILGRYSNMWLQGKQSTSQCNWYISANLKVPEWLSPFHFPLDNNSLIPLNDVQLVRIKTTVNGIPCLIVGKYELNFPWSPVRRLSWPWTMIRHLRKGEIPIKRKIYFWSRNQRVWSIATNKKGIKTRESSPFLGRSNRDRGISLQYS